MTKGDVKLKGIRRGEKREEKTLGGPQGDKTRFHERESSYKRGERDSVLFYKQIKKTIREVQ